MNAESSRNVDKRLFQDVTKQAEYWLVFYNTISGHPLWITGELDRWP